MNRIVDASDRSEWITNTSIFPRQDGIPHIPSRFLVGDQACGDYMIPERVRTPQ